jgi:hypothetical protein
MFRGGKVNKEMMPINTMIHNLLKLKEDMKKTHQTQLDIIDGQIETVQKLCPHTNPSKSGGWEGETFYLCLECLKGWE